jgi:hypothetical protein
MKVRQEIKLFPFDDARSIGCDAACVPTWWYAGWAGFDVVKKRPEDGREAVASPRRFFGDGILFFSGTTLFEFYLVI